jgi:hypothetical protein
MLEIRHKYVSAGDLLFGSIVVWGSECATYAHQSSSRCHKRQRGTQLVESLLQWTSWLNLFFNGPRSAEDS